jgi:predicted short-subunit dehydrogenase-like oxidoreductase (DUF2520 family)
MDQIVIIGAGKIAYSLIAALIKKYPVKAIISKNILSAKRLANKYSIPVYSDDLSKIPTDCNLIFLAVSDDQISLAAERLSRLKINFSDKLFTHLSGSENITALKSLKKKRASVASLHIMQTFPSKKPVNISGCRAAIEAENKKTKSLLFNLAASLKLKPFAINSDEKILYHLSGVFASNFLVGNIFCAKNIFGQGSSANIFHTVEPIINSTLKNIKKNNVVKSLSGPIERGDLKTIKNHLKSLTGRNKKLYKLSYIAQSLTLIQVMKKKSRGLSPDHIKIKKILERELNRSI